MTTAPFEPEKTALVINFPKNINSIEFEKILREQYYKSKLKKYPKIIFNLKDVIFCGLLELSQTALWISHLNAHSKQVRVVLPDESEFYRFLYNYEFINFLVKLNILDSNIKHKKTFTPYSSPMFPLKFQDNIEFKEFLADLNNPKRLELLLNDIKNTELVKNNVIHSIILREIGDNIFMHSRSPFSNVVMTKLKKLPLHKCIEFELHFLNSLSAGELLVIIISDYGKGLYKTLIGPYLADKILPASEKKTNPSEVDIIQYSFLKHSTSRSDEERKSDLLRNITSNTLKYPIPTGLYKVKNIIKQYNGMLYVRSGKSAVCFDFFSEKGGERVFTNKSDRKMTKLAHFPGTQYRIYFPIQESSTTVNSFYLPDSPNALTSSYRLLDFISLNDFIDTSLSEINQTSVSKVQSFLDKVESVKLQHGDKSGGILVDVSNFRYVMNKNIKHLIVTSMMAAQTSSLSFIIINIDRKHILELFNDFSDGALPNYFKPLLTYDKTYIPLVIGFAKPYLNELQSIYNTYKSENERNTFFSECKHILNVDDIITLNFNKPDILHFYSTSLSKCCKNKVLDASYNVYYKHQKALIPNKYYCLGFFELNNILDSPLLLSEVKAWIEVNLQQLKPDCIITIGATSKAILEAIYNDFSNQDIKIKATKHNIDVSNIYMSAYHLQPKIKEDDSVVFITDVIGSAKTLITTIDQLNRRNIKQILSIVNATPNNALFINKIKFPIDCIVERHIEYFPSMPKGWDYSKIKIFDQKNNRLNENTTLPEGPLLTKLGDRQVRDEDGHFTITINTFLEDLANANESYFYGHFESRNNHLVYLFNISSIIDEYSKEISDCITEYLFDIKNKIACSDEVDFSNTKFSFLLFPSFNPGLDRIAQEIAKKIPNLLLLPISPDDLENGLSAKYDFTDNSIILIDDAFVTGTTIEKLIDIASEKRAKYIFSFVLLKRGDSYQARKYEKWKQYGDSIVHSRYLFDAEIPIYKQETCPICRKIIQYDLIKSELSDSEAFEDLGEFIGSLMENYQLQPVGAVFAEQKHFISHSYSLPSQLSLDARNQGVLDKPYFTKLNLRWKLEVALSNTSMRKNISDILRGKPEYKKTILTIFNIFSDEKSYFIENSRNFEKLFYDKFQSILVNRCKSYLDDLRSLSPYDILSIIDLLIVFEESYFLENFPTLLETFQDNEPTSYCVILGVLLSNAKIESPLRISRKLKNVLPLIENNKLSRLLSSLIIYFQTKHDQKLKAANNALNIYSESVVTLHNINHILNSIDYYLTPDFQDKAAFMRNMHGFIEEYDTFYSKIRVFADNLYSKISFQRMNDTLYKIAVSVKEIKRLAVTDHFEDNISSYKVYFDRVKSFLTQRRQQDSLPNILESYRLDIKKICFESLSQDQKELEARNIECDFFFPDIPCVTFGEEKQLILIFKNLIENSYLHSNGSRLVIHGFIDKKDGKLNILFIDDGAEPKHIEYKEGLLSVTKSVNACRGGFEISPISVSKHKNLIFDSFPDIRHGTVAEVRLSLLRD